MTRTAEDRVTFKNVDGAEQVAGGGEPRVCIGQRREVDRGDHNVAGVVSDLDGQRASQTGRTVTPQPNL